MNSTEIGFVHEPNCGRGTIGILWSCATTILLCTYIALHLHVPGGRHHMGKEPREYASTELILQKTKFVALSLIFPETLISAGEMACP